MDAMSCWFDNRDNVEANTIVGNLREGISVVGASKTNLVRNVFIDNPIGIVCSKIASRRGATGRVTQWRSEGSRGQLLLQQPQADAGWRCRQAAAARNESADPKLTGPADNFKLKADSPARQANAGAADPIPFASPFAIQPEEKLMIPDSDTRDFSKWKKAAATRPH